VRNDNRADTAPAHPICGFGQRFETGPHKATATASAATDDPATITRELLIIQTINFIPWNVPGRDPERKNLRSTTRNATSIHCEAAKSTCNGRENQQWQRRQKTFVAALRFPTEQEEVRGSAQRLLKIPCV